MVGINMLTLTPFLKGFSTLLFGSAKRKEQVAIQAEREALVDRECGPLSSQLADEIPAELVSRNSATIRKRIYSHEITFWAFLSQVISEDGSCAYAVAQVQQWMRGCGKEIPSSETSSYVAARRALPAEVLKAIHQDLSRHLIGIFPATRDGMDTASWLSMPPPCSFRIPRRTKLPFPNSLVKARDAGFPWHSSWG